MKDYFKEDPDTVEAHLETFVRKVGEDIVMQADKTPPRKITPGREGKFGVNNSERRHNSKEELL